MTYKNDISNGGYLPVSRGLEEFKSPLSDISKKSDVSSYISAPLQASTPPEKIIDLTIALIELYKLQESLQDTATIARYDSILASKVSDIIKRYQGGMITAHELVSSIIAS